MWTAAVVIGAGDIAKRKNALKKMIEMAHHLQSDALVNLHSFMAVMRGLELPQVIVSSVLLRALHEQVTCSFAQFVSLWLIFRLTQVILKIVRIMILGGFSIGTDI